jgi:hypothetical protein
MMVSSGTDTSKCDDITSLPEKGTLQPYGTPSHIPKREMRKI